MAWVDEEISVFLAKHEFGSECYRFTRHSSLDSKQQPQSGAAGGAIIFNGKVMLLGSDNFLRAPKERESELLLLKDCSNDNENDESDSDNYERNDGDDNDDTAIRLFKSMRSQERRRKSSKAVDQLYARGELRGLLIGKTKPVLRDHRLWYALFEMDLVSCSDSLYNDAIPLDDLSRIEPGARETDVMTVTPNGGVVYGQLYAAEFANPIIFGDGGCWVRDRTTGRLFGHIIGQCSNLSANTLIMPAKDVFEHALTKLQERKHKNQLHEVQAGKDGQILIKVGGASAGSEGGSVGMDCGNK
ncbi:uncharacterized protein TRIVIDRAFT_198914 [Trichoderma virens Gv29-8]|uniref:Uncharacterized protein n=1 Tax=Hypocrea virens (strain Gv29-8 / FGSC 10586) TaxID=413071 RepID=G9MLR8_HYPVG|nr:uncharacterized protein TRIVIDRAFT_198914 [Trichoderma virens Gv29-8]EHK24295.1 hypothetical protein TRIVIDRAFT_198914 [Trichoderma virens Gv29-8]UKZ54560.1 hypothetical protein TrVGV298_008369 [Trichoderma virens]